MLSGVLVAEIGNLDFIVDDCCRFRFQDTELMG